MAQFVILVSDPLTNISPSMLHKFYQRDREDEVQRLLYAGTFATRPEYLSRDQESRRVFTVSELRTVGASETFFVPVGKTSTSIHLCYESGPRTVFMMVSKGELGLGNVLQYLTLHETLPTPFPSPRRTARDVCGAMGTWRSLWEWGSVGGRSVNGPCDAT
jgi:hypothetical protein